ncbi:small integral membrane protein 29 isoform X1 [Electrophorus electricus]|uniref:small integral membrane protein 29 isoform X1 n=1 Tax=Electrophorus electricus TaxID=8005 RepID=UPI000F0A75F3|nr:small integral membrane protein 29 isoform X1 [Electrophorus electricus]
MTEMSDLPLEEEKSFHSVANRIVSQQNSYSGGQLSVQVLYLRRKQRIDRLRHQLLPVYTYDPSEELNEAELEMLWREEDTKMVQGWMRSYQPRWSRLAKDPDV